MNKRRGMKKHEILSPQSRVVLFHPPTDPAAIVRYYSFSPEDIALIRRRRRDANRLGFAVNLAYLRFPGRVLRADETPPADMLAFIAGQIGCDPTEFASYARRDETRWEHLGELQTYLNARPFRREDTRAVAQAGIGEATGSDRGDAIISSMIAYLRERIYCCRRHWSWSVLRSRHARLRVSALIGTSSKACRQNDRRVESFARRHRR